MDPRRRIVTIVAVVMAAFLSVGMASASVRHSVGSLLGGHRSKSAPTVLHSAPAADVSAGEDTSTADETKSDDDQLSEGTSDDQGDVNDDQGDQGDVNDEQSDQGDQGDDDQGDVNDDQGDQGGDAES